MSKIKPTLIEIIRAEGPSALCGKVQTATSWHEADMILRANAATAPKGGGYDKHDFRVTFADGTVYFGRYYLKHWSEEHPDLARHVRAFFLYLAGHAPAWMTDRPEVLARYQKDREANPEQVAEAKRWLETYDVGQAR